MAGTRHHTAGSAGGAWSREEVEAAVADYFAMLEKELRGERFRKSEHRGELLRRLRDRSASAVENKHRNVSAVLNQLGKPYVEGYKPLGNYQALLRDVVLERLPAATALLAAMEGVARAAPDAVPALPPLSRVLVPPPPRREPRAAPAGGVPSPPEPPSAPLRTGVDYVALERANRRLGELGEAFVVAYESERLRAAGRADLAAEVEWSAKVRGDGLGYDVRSFAEDGAGAYIEVKTTNLGSYHPFFLTRGEFRASERLGAAWRLYRVFHFSREPRLFVLEGAISGHEVRLEPQVYLAYP